MVCCGYKKLSIQAVDILSELSQSNNRNGHQFHSHTSTLSDIENRIGYAYLVALLKELDQIGFIEIQTNHSSVVGNNPRFIAYWRDVANEFITFLRDAQ